MGRYSTSHRMNRVFRPDRAALVEAELEAARVAYDLGADIIKINFPGPAATAKLVPELGIPVVVAGGTLNGDAKTTLKDVTEAIEAGAQGVVVGRKVWQRPAEEAGWLIAEMAKRPRALPSPAAGRGSP